jgi:hypothetical protein
MLIAALLRENCHGLKIGQSSCAQVRTGPVLLLGTAGLQVIEFMRPLVLRQSVTLPACERDGAHATVSLLVNE